MNNSEILVLIMDTLKISKADFEKSLTLGGVTDDETISTALINCDKSLVESFLNGFITLKRGAKEKKPGEKSKAPLALKQGKSVNNVILKKLKIAYALTNEDLMDIFESVGVTMTKNDLTTFFRKEGHKHYRLCQDRDLINFLEGLSLRS